MSTKTFGELKLLIKFSAKRKSKSLQFLHTGKCTNFLVGSDDGTVCIKGPLGLGKLLLLPFFKLFNKDILSSRDYHLDFFVNSSDSYHL